MIKFGSKVKSLRNNTIGDVVGFGTICWPTSEHHSGDGGEMQQVVLVQIAQASSSLGPACAVFRLDQVDEVSE